MPKVFHCQTNCDAFSTQAAGGDPIPIDKFAPAGIEKARKKRKFANPGREHYVFTWSVIPWWSEDGNGLMVTARAHTIEVAARATTVLVTARATTLKSDA